MDTNDPYDYNKNQNQYYGSAVKKPKYKKAPPKKIVPEDRKARIYREAGFDLKTLHSLVLDDSEDEIKDGGVKAILRKKQDRLDKTKASRK